MKKKVIIIDKNSAYYNYVGELIHKENNFVVVKINDSEIVFEAKDISEWK